MIKQNIDSNSKAETIINESDIDDVFESSYTKEWHHPRKGLINIQNIYDNQCFKWSLVRYLNTADRNEAIITKADKNFSKNFDFERHEISSKN